MHSSIGIMERLRRMKVGLVSGSCLHLLHIWREDWVQYDYKVKIR